MRSNTDHYVYYKIVPWAQEKIIKEDIDIGAYWMAFVQNPSPGAANIVLEHLHKSTTVLTGRVCIDLAKLSPHKDVLEFITSKRYITVGTRYDAYRSIDGICSFWKYLCGNKSAAAIDVIANNLDQIAEHDDDGSLWSHLATNLFAGAVLKFAPTSEIYLRTTPQSSMLNNMLHNSCPEAVEIILANVDYMYWPAASGNSDPRITELFIERARACNGVFIDTYGYLQHDSVWEYFNENTCPLAIEYLATYPNKIVWKILSKNYSREAVALLAINLNNIRWEEFSTNPLPEAVALMKLHPEKIHWAELSKNTNPDAVAMLEHIPIHKIDLPSLFENPAIFEQTYNYAAIRANMDIHREELSKVAGHPRRLVRYLEAGCDPDDF
jgi:hypothetical protein